jgi:hypothetical protein
VGKRRGVSEKWEMRLSGKRGISSKRERTIGGKKED